MFSKQLKEELEARSESKSVNKAWGLLRRRLRFSPSYLYAEVELGHCRLGPAHYNRVSTLTLESR